MSLKATLCAVLIFGPMLVSPEAARAQSQGILTCQIDLSQFAEDIYASKSRLQPGQLANARQLTAIGRGQCRSTPDLVMGNIRAQRLAMNLAMGSRISTRFDDFWPASPQELSLLSER